MAHAISASPVINVHQTLHGYTDGHTQLLGSTALSARDSRAMLVLSDLSGPGIQIDQAGYLTGYPLPESKVYVLARTWPATELPRPGCVWTHSLLIDFADLANITELSDLLAYFRRPGNGSPTDYGQPLTVNCRSSAKALGSAAALSAGHLLFALYDNPNRSIVFPRPTSIDADGLVMSIWSQQWPRLRRTFRFSTMTGADRSTDGASFDLQLLPSDDRHLRSRFPSALDAFGLGTRANDANAPWQLDAIADLISPAKSDLRAFMRRIGGDISTGRDAFRPICTLHSLIGQFATDPKAISSAAVLIETELNAVKARSAKALVATAAMETIDNPDGPTAEFLLRNLDLVDEDAMERGAPSLGKAVWARDAARFSELFESGGRLGWVAEAAVKQLTVPELLQGLDEAPQVALTVIAIRPQILEVPALWQRDWLDISSVMSLIRGSGGSVGAALDAMVRSQNAALARVAVDIAGSYRVLEVLDQRAAQGETQPATWIVQATRDASAVAQYLVDGRPKTWPFLCSLAAYGSPDKEPNYQNQDPWVTATWALRQATNLVQPLSLSAFLFTRALGTVTSNSVQLAELAFEPLVLGAKAGQLSVDAWTMLTTRLPWSLGWRTPDRAEKIISAVVTLFVDRDVNPASFVNLTSKDAIFAGLCDEAFRSGRGTRYLDQVKQWLRQNSAGRFDNRTRYLEKLLR